jgi:hypothetical protein
VIFDENCEKLLFVFAVVVSRGRESKKRKYGGNPFTALCFAFSPFFLLGAVQPQRSQS